MKNCARCGRPSAKLLAEICGNCGQDLIDEAAADAALERHDNMTPAERAADQAPADFPF